MFSILLVFPVSSTEVMAILEGLLRPDVQNYIRELINHTQQMCNSQVFVYYVVEYVIVSCHLNFILDFIINPTK